MCKTQIKSYHLFFCIDGTFFATKSELCIGLTIQLPVCVTVAESGGLYYHHLALKNR